MLAFRVYSFSASGFITPYEDTSLAFSSNPMNRCIELNDAYVTPAKRPIPILNRELGPRKGFRAPKNPNAKPPVVKRRIFLNILQDVIIEKTTTRKRRKEKMYVNVC